MNKKRRSYLYTLLFLLIQLTLGFTQQLLEYQDSAGIDHAFFHEAFLGGGAAFLDYDNDGDEDIYITSGLRPDHFYVNDGAGHFENRAGDAGLAITGQYNTMGVIAGDIDNDGYTDLFVTTKQRTGDAFSRNLLFHNQGDGTFEEIWRRSSLQPGWSMAATFLDYNLDGLLDLYIGNYVEVTDITYGSGNTVESYNHSCFSNQLFKNIGDGTFRQVTEEANLIEMGCTLGVSASDYDDDGDLDVLTANDFGPFIEPNTLFSNQDRIFQDVGEAVNANQAIYGMGIAVGDYDNDLDLDYYVTNLGSNLLLQNDNGIFTDQAVSANAANTRNPLTADALAVGWGCSFLDIDNDTDLDLYIANGFIPGIEPTYIDDNDQVLLNNGDGTFLEDSTQFAIDNPFVSRGAITGDIDNDGDLDVLVVVQRAPFNATFKKTKLFLNQSANTPNWLKIKLVGQQVNKTAIGSKAYLYAQGNTFMREVSGGASHNSHSSTVLHFGLAQLTAIDSLKIIWTGGAHQETLYDITPNQTLVIEEAPISTSTSTFDLAQPSMKLYPNPSTSELFLEIKGLPVVAEQQVVVEFFSITGRSVYRQIIPSYSERRSINIVAFPVGIYLAKITYDGKVAMQKWVKE